MAPRTAARQPPGGGAWPAFVGREPERVAVTEALAAPPALVLVGGEAGIGKTRLVHECLAERAGPRALVAACPPLPEPFPLGGLVEALRGGGHRIRELGLSPLGGALRPVFPEWAADLPPPLAPADDPATTRHRLLRAMVELLDRLGVAVLAVEDAHWADQATLELLLMLVAASGRSASGARGQAAPEDPASDHPGRSIVVTYRPADVPADSPLWRLASHQPARVATLRVELAPFDPDEVRQLVLTMFGGTDVSPPFARFLHGRTAGIPLALVETLRLLRDRRDIVRRGGSWSRRAIENLRVPPTVRDSVLERLHRLAPAAQRMLHAAAVLAEPADEGLLARVAGLAAPAAERGIAEALASGLLWPEAPGRFGFRHMLAREAVEGAIVASHRRRLHREAADFLQAQDPTPVVRLCRHCREAGDVAGWVRYAAAAADLAWESGDDRTSVTLLEELLTTTRQPAGQRVTLGRKLGERALSAANPLGPRTAGAATALRAVLATAGLPARDRGELRLLLGRLLLGLNQNDTAYEEIETALSDLDDQPALAARAMLHLAWPWAGSWPAQWHRQWLDRATRLIPDVESAETRLSLEIRRVMALLLLGDEAGWTAAGQLPRSGATSFVQQEIAQGTVNLAQAATVWGHYHRARRLLGVAGRLIETLELPRLADTVRTAEAHLDWYTGAWRPLPEVLAELVASEETSPGNVLEARSIQGLLDLTRGEPDSARQRLREVAEESARRGSIEPLILPGAALARLSLARGEVDAALPATEPDMRRIAGKGLWVWATDLAPAHVDALVAGGQVARAEQLVAEFASGLAGRDAPAAAAALATCRAIVAEAGGSPRQAAARFATAADAWAALPRPYDALLAAERRGRCLLAAGDRDQAVRVLTDVLARLRELGARWDADRVATLLRQCAPGNRGWRGGRHGYGDQLSPRELEVVRLVATGLSNAEVASALCLSRKTVSHHVSAALRKLGQTSRTGLAVAAADAGLLAAATPAASTSTQPGSPSTPAGRK